MMVAALERAGQDAGAPKLLQRANSIYVIRGMWGYGDPGRAIARRLGATPGETVGTPYGGNFAQACVIDAAREIQAGRRDVVLVTGAENGRSQGQAQRQGVALRESEAPGSPDRKIAEDKAIFHEAELARGMNSASDVFAIIESAIRFANGETLGAHARRIAELWAGFNAVACGNPHAWIRQPWTAEQIGQASPDNPMISYPYTRLMNANAARGHGGRSHALLARDRAERGRARGEARLPARRDGSQRQQLPLHAPRVPPLARDAHRGWPCARARREGDRSDRPRRSLQLLPLRRCRSLRRNSAFPKAAR